MTAQEARNMITSRLRLMDFEARAEVACELYDMDVVDRKKARMLLGINEEAFQERMQEAKLEELEFRFSRLDDEFLSRKIKAIMDDNGEY